MNTKELYDQWVEKVCEWIKEVGPVVNGPQAVMQTPPALDHAPKVLFLGHDAHEPYPYDGENRDRFYKGNEGWSTALTWRYWSRVHNSLHRIGAGDILEPGNFMLMNLFYFGADNIGKANQAMNGEVWKKCLRFTDELVHEIIKPKAIVCFSVSAVYNPLCNKTFIPDAIADSQIVTLSSGNKVRQGTWAGIPVVGMKHPSARNLSNDELDATLALVNQLAK